MKCRHVLIAFYACVAISMKKLKIGLALLATSNGVQFVDFPRIPQIKAIKMPSLDDFVKEEEQKAETRKVDSWKYPLIYHN